MSNKFDEAFANALECIFEMAVSLKGKEKVTQHLDAIERDKLPHHYQKNLMKLKSKAERDEAVGKIIDIVFQGKNYAPDIHNKKQLQQELGKAARQVLGGGSLFNDYLGKWLGSNIEAEIIDTSEGEKGASAKEATDAVKDVVADVAKEVEKAPEVAPEKEPETAKDAAKDLKQAASGEDAAGNGPEQEVNPDQTYEILESSLEQLEQELEKVNKRAYRYGIPPAKIIKLGERFTTTSKKHDLDTERTIKLVQVKLDIPAPKLPGDWKFIARIDHESFGNVIMQAPGTKEFDGELHKMFGASQPSGCDHCNRQRNRTNTFVVQDAAGKLKRVGRACLKDYIPGGESSAQKLVAWAELWTKIVQGLVEMSDSSEDSDGEGGGGGGGSRENDYFQVEFVLGTGLFVSDKFGYLSAKNARANVENESGPTESTSAKVDKILNNTFSGKEIEDKGPLYLAAEEWQESEDFRKPYIEKAREILKWASAYTEAQLKDPNNSMKDYFSNLKVMVDAASKPGQDYVKGKHFGYLVSLVPMYNRAMESEKETKKDAEKKQSEYIGTMGYPIGELTAADKRKIKKSGISVNLEQFPYNGPIKMKVTGTRTFATQGFGYYGGDSTAYMTSFEDENGSVYTWIATYDPGFKEGEEVVLERATVKNHKDYTNKKTGRVTKQTVIKRPKFQGQAEAE